MGRVLSETTITTFPFLLFFNCRLSGRQPVGFEMESNSISFTSACANPYVGAYRRLLSGTFNLNSFFPYLKFISIKQAFEVWCKDKSFIDSL